MDENLKERTIATLRMMGIGMIPAFNVLDESVSRPTVGESPRATRERNLHAAIRRLEKNVQRSENKWASKWYADSLQLVKNKIQPTLPPEMDQNEQERDRARRIKEDTNDEKDQG